LILKDLARAAENGRRPGLANTDIDACDLRIVEPFDEDRVSPIVNDRDDNGRVALFRLGLGGSGYFFRRFQSENLFLSQLRAPDSLPAGATVKSSYSQFASF